MAKLYNLARMSTATTGTGAITLGSAVSGCLSFAAAGVADGDTITYAIREGANSEIGRGVYTASGPTLTRSVLKSTNSNSPISLTGTAEVFITAAAEDFADRYMRRNRAVNGSMQISQQNGNTSGTSDSYYVADQWFMRRVTSAGTFTAQRVQSATPAGAADRARITITTQDASLAAGEYLVLETRIEGLNVVDLQWGTAAAKQIVVSFLGKMPSGTYACYVKNSAGNRTYVRTFSPASANTDEIFAISFPGDTSGTWLQDTGIGLTFGFCIAAGSTFQTTANAWQAGDYLGTSATVTGIATASAVFEFGDVGIYLDPESSSIAPAYEVPGYADVLRACQRYFWRAIQGNSVYITMMQNWATTRSFCGTLLPTTMRSAPTLSVSAASHFGVHDSTGNLVACTALNLVQSGVGFFYLDATVASGLVAGNATMFRSSNSSATLDFNARL